MANSQYVLKAQYVPICCSYDNKVLETNSHVLCVCSGYLSRVPLWGDPRQTPLPPLCLHWQYQVYPPGMVSVFVSAASLRPTLLPLCVVFAAWERYEPPAGILKSVLFPCVNITGYRGSGEGSPQAEARPGLFCADCWTSVCFSLHPPHKVQTNSLLCMHCVVVLTTQAAATLSCVYLMSFLLI